MLIPCAEKQINANWSAEQQMLVNLFDLIEKNNNMISALGKVFLFKFRHSPKIQNNLRKVPFKQNPLIKSSTLNNNWLFARTTFPPFHPISTLLFAHVYLETENTNIR